MPGKAAKDMGKSVHEPALTVCKVQNAADIRLRQLIKERVVRRFAVAGILQGPARVTAVRLDLEVLILPRGDAPVDLGDARLKLFFQLRQMLLDRLLEAIQSGLGNQRILVPPLLVVEEIIFHAAEPDAVAAEDIACLQAVAQMLV